MAVLGRHIHAARKKTGDPYEYALNGQHIQVLEHLEKRPSSDWQIVHAYKRGSHQLGARRCELRDARFVELDGRNDSGFTWRLTVAGHDLLREYRSEQ